MPPLLRCPGSRRCPVSFLQYYRCHWEVWVGDQPWSRLPCWVLARCPARPSRSSRPKQGWALSKGVCRAAQPPRSISRTPAGPQSSCWSPRAYPLFQALSCWGHWGSLCYKLTLQQQCWTLFHGLNFPFAAAFHVVLLRPRSTLSPLVGSGVVLEPPWGLHSGRGWGLVESRGSPRASSEKAPSPPALGAWAAWISQLLLSCRA